MRNEYNGTIVGYDSISDSHAARAWSHVCSESDSMVAMTSGDGAFDFDCPEILQSFPSKVQYGAALANENVDNRVPGTGQDVYLPE